MMARMPSNGETAHALLTAAVGQPPVTGEWLEITQERIDTFADATDDHQFIHVDPEACATYSPWGVPVAHGFLTLSLLTALAGSVPQDPRQAEGRLIGINYGFDRVRFLSPVKVGSRVRAAVAVDAVDLKDPNTVQVTQTVTVEIEGESKPALAAAWITRHVYG
jgi:acyl dehydratase